MGNFTLRMSHRLNKIIYCLLTALIISLSGYSQNVGINTTGTAPNANAGLDVDFTNKGLLIPRIALTGTANFAPLSAHVAGMIVYNTATAGDVVPGFYYNNGTKWISGFPLGTAIGDILYWSGTAWNLLPVGTIGQYLTLNASNIPSWATGSVGGVFATLTTTTASAITGISATSGGNITSDGGSAVLQRGVCWNTVTGPTIANSKTIDGLFTGTSLTGVFISSLTGLLPGTPYFVRSYAMNSNTITYGNELTFTTSAIAPTLGATTAATLITGTTALTGGSITSTGGAAITEKGICYSTTVTSPTILNTKLVDASLGLTITSPMTGLSANTLYYVRSYATNSAGLTGYGALMTFYTRPIVTTTAATSITGGSAVAGGVLTAGQGSWYYGIAYSTISNAPSPTLAQAATFPNTSPIPFTVNLTGLTSNTTYYIRGYVIGSGYTVYGPELSFTTAAPTAPVVASTNAITNISSSTGTSGGSITSDGGSPVTVKGVCWGTSANPIIGSGNFTSDGSGSAAFVSNITGLTGSTTYHVRAYATNLIGTSFGPDISFTTWVTAPYTIGQYTGYGWCAYVAPDGTGFIVSPDIASTAPWGCSGTTIATSTALGTGLANTNLILASCATRPIAASVASSYNGGGFSDWYLPSDGEWQQIANRYTLYGFAGGYTNYLTSSASSLTYAGSYFYTGAQAYYMGSLRAGGDTYATAIRAIRSFAAPTAPIVSLTTSAYAITPTTASSGGNVASDGGMALTAVGVCWSTTTGPTVALATKTVDGTATGTFVSSLTGLTNGILYYVRAYATNGVGTSYGPEISFTAGVAILVPTVTTDPMGSLVGAIAEGGYTVINEGASAATAAGLVWSTSANPTKASHVGGGIAPDPIWATGLTGTSFPIDMTALTIGTLYHVRAYATNGSGTGYGADITFTATAATLGQLVFLNQQSGYVFFANAAGSHGLIALSFTPGQPTDWGCPLIYIGTTLTAQGTGKANTTAILNNITATPCTSAAPVGVFAPQLCQFYDIPNWYLPSKAELALLWTNRGVDPTGTLNTLISTTIAGAPVWSSSEVDATHAWSLDGTGTMVNTGLKTDLNNVMPIRSF